MTKSVERFGIQLDLRLSGVDFLASDLDYGQGDRRVGSVFCAAHLISI